jgi:hydroxyacyl-ACP dehydratase HTD2-like protein with hotdog domain
MQNLFPGRVHHRSTFTEEGLVMSGPMTVLTSLNQIDSVRKQILIQIQARSIDAFDTPADSTQPHPL